MRTSPLVLIFVAATAACSASPADDATNADAITNSEAGGIATGSSDAEGVLIYANDRSVGLAELAAAGVSPPFAGAIVGARIDASGKPAWLANVAAIERLPGSSGDGFAHLLAAATAAADVEPPGFDPPTASQIVVPPGLGHAPTSDDVSVAAGFDGKTPADVQAIVRSRLMNTVDRTNETFTNRTIVATHKAFTIGLGNLFVSGSPPAAFVAGLGADKITFLGTMSSVTPTIIQAETAGATTFYAHASGGGYAAIATPRYPIIMRAKVALAPQGVRVFYPAWAAPVLRAPTGVIVEGS